MAAPVFAAVVFGLEVVAYRLVDALLVRLGAGWLRWLVGALFWVAVGWEAYGAATGGLPPATTAGAPKPSVADGLTTPRRAARGGGRTAGASPGGTARRRLRTTGDEAPSATTPALSDKLAGLLGESPWLLRYVELPGGAAVTTFEVVMTRFDRPWRDVMRALDAKFNMTALNPAASAADAIQPPVLSIYRQSDRTLAAVVPPAGLGGGDAAADGDGAPSAVRLYAEKQCMGLPSLVARLTGATSLEVLVDGEVHPGRRRMWGWTRNGNLTGVGCFQEWSLYRPHPDDPDGATQYVSVVQVATTSWVGRKVLSLAGGTGAGLIKEHVDLLRARLAELPPAAAEDGEGGEEGGAPAPPRTPVRSPQPSARATPAR